MPLSHHSLAYMGLLVFCIAYFMVMIEEFTKISKSKPVILAAGILWAFAAYVGIQQGVSQEVTMAFRENLLEYSELFLFLLVAMTYIVAMEERNVFEKLRAWLIKRQFSYKQLFWITGFLSFLMSPIADNLTTALIMCSVVMAVGSHMPRFVSLSCINIVVAVNAGGAFSPFGDITTLMVWQKGVLQFQDFFHLFVPALVNFVVPAALMHHAIPGGRPSATQAEGDLKEGGAVIVGLFLLTILTATLFLHCLHLPPTLGMMTGLAYLQIYASILKRKTPFDIFHKIKQIEWDTLLFFYGILMCVGAIATFGYLAKLNDLRYNGPFGHSVANTALGFMSAIVDNIPVMFAVLSMDPPMSMGQWLLVTLTAGVGGSLLSIGSAAGVALMGQTKGHYTFVSHLKWSWAILIGYFCSIGAHLVLNKGLF